MARARSIKPGFFRNEDLAECSFEARLCFAGLWTLADRAGRLEDRPKRIKADLFAFDSVDIERMLGQLEQRGFIVRYAVNGRGLIQIVNFSKHQNPHHREPESDLPCQESPGLESHAMASKPEASPGPSPVEPEESPGQALGEPESSPELALLTPDSLYLTPHSLTPEKKTAPLPQKAAGPPPPPFDGRNAEALNGKSVVAISPAFDIPEEWGTDAEALGFKPAEVMREAEKFRQYWTVGKGAGKRRSVKGWRQSWSNWLGRAAGDR